MTAPLVALYTDFGHSGPYVGQMHTVLAGEAPGHAVIDLMHDAPAFAPKPAAYLLAQLVELLPRDAVVCAVVDPGVGSERLPVVVRADGRWLVGPGNGLMEIAARRAAEATCYRIAWRPSSMSASFHGRDLFAPVAARLARDGIAAARALLAAEPSLAEVDYAGWPDDLPEIVYVDGYGNAMTGLRASAVGEAATVGIDGRKLPRACTFSDVSTGQAFCYENSIGLLEIAVNQGNVADSLGLSIGKPVEIVDTAGM